VAEEAETVRLRLPGAATTPLLRIAFVAVAAAAAAVAEWSTTTRRALRGRGGQPKSTLTFWERSITAFM
jgi:hypothetical protein